MLQDYKLGLRMLVKFPGLTIAGGLALAIAIGGGAGYYDLFGKALTPSIPLFEGDRLVLLETQNTLMNAPESSRPRSAPPGTRRRRCCAQAAAPAPGRRGPRRPDTRSRC